MKLSNLVFVVVSALFFASNLWAQEFVVVKEGVPLFAKASAKKPMRDYLEGSGAYVTLALLKKERKRSLVTLNRLARGCYPAALDRSVELSFWVDNKHFENVTTASMAWTLEEGCLVELIKKVRFKASPKERTLYLPLTFKMQSSR